jgi:hypothetical protein
VSERDWGPHGYLVGEDNPHSRDPRYALFDKPENAAGANLRRILGLHRTGYLFALARRNLCAASWNDLEAKATADLIRAESGELVVVMLGRKVATAFGLARLKPWTREGRFVAIPHPSGRNPAWNDPGAVDRTRALLREVAPQVPWGISDAPAR